MSRDRYRVGHLQTRRFQVLSFSLLVIQRLFWRFVLEQCWMDVLHFFVIICFSVPMSTKSCAEAMIKSFCSRDMDNS